MTQFVNFSPTYSSQRPLSNCIPAQRTPTINTKSKEMEEEDWPDPPAWPEPIENIYDSKMDVQVLSYDQIYRPPIDSVSSPVPQQYTLASAYPSSRGALPTTKVLPPYSSLRPTSVRAGRMHPTLDYAHYPAALGIQPLSHPMPAPVSVCLYSGPKPFQTIPTFIHPDPNEFARLRIALTNLLPLDATELFKYQILVDHLKLEEASLPQLTNSLY